MQKKEACCPNSFLGRIYRAKRDMLSQIDWDNRGLRSKLLSEANTIQLSFQACLFSADEDRALVLSNEGTVQDGACRKARN